MKSVLNYLLYTLIRLGGEYVCIVSENRGTPKAKGARQIYLGYHHLLNTYFTSRTLLRALSLALLTTLIRGPQLTI